MCSSVLEVGIGWVWVGLLCSLDYNLNGQVPEGEDSGQGIVRVRCTGGVEEEQEAVYHEDHRHLQDG